MQALNSLHVSVFTELGEMDVTKIESWKKVHKMIEHVYANEAISIINPATTRAELFIYKPPGMLCCWPTDFFINLTNVRNSFSRHQRDSGICRNCNRAAEGQKQ